MYEQYALECYRDEQPRVIFGLGHEYEFMSGLVCRWHEDSKQGQVIDFSLSPEAAQKRPELLLDIVRLLKQTGIHEEATLLKVRRAIEEILAGSARAQSLG
jgi:hypothetical protein